MKTCLFNPLTKQLDLRPFIQLLNAAPEAAAVLGQLPLTEIFNLIRPRPRLSLREPFLPVERRHKLMKMAVDRSGAIRFDGTERGLNCGFELLGGIDIHIPYDLHAERTASNLYMSSIVGVIWVR